MTTRHFILVLPAVSPVGDRPHYLWVLQKWLHEFRTTGTTIILPEFYRSAFGEPKRWEFGQWSAGFHGYEPVRDLSDHPASMRFYPSGTGGDPATAPNVRFSDSVRTVDDSLAAFYTGILQDVRAQTGARPVLVAWVNNATLRSVAATQDADLTFNEIGPLRRPHYRQTAYWDTHGVNGDTSVPTLWEAERSDFERWLGDHPEFLSPEGVQRVFTTPRQHRPQPETAVGLALQIETDSNALLFSRGWNNLSVLEYLQEQHRPDDYLIRYHPNGKALYTGPTDRTASPLDFLFRVKTLWTINSSLGIEAFFWSHPVRFFGNSPVSLFLTMTENEKAAFRAWFFLRYLIPWRLLFSTDYYAWRFEAPSCVAITERHLRAYGEESPVSSGPVPGTPSDLKPVMVPPLPQALTELDEDMITVLRGRIADRNRWIADRDRWIAERDDTITLLRSRIKDRDKWVSDRDRWIADRDVWIAERDETIALLRSQIEDRDHRIAERDSTIETLKQNPA
ncbi:hypothetical protein GOB93_09115 [Acetobacter musti]|uniref:Glycosyltransferase 99 N-terminal domain-containing protein n=1 Tax=Acetobacter musti TaxID=864732 RepID=A0ABX0JS71_9PROT|nr:hypothetical protein [Acetobacter musti]NHN84800.1 hypothetical protein [Acetobacter musti]